MATGNQAVSGDDQVDAVCDEPETDEQAPRDDHLVLVDFDPGDDLTSATSQPGYMLVLLGAAVTPEMIPR